MFHPPRGFPNAPTLMHVYEVRPRKDKRGVDLLSDALAFGRLWYGESNAINNAIGYAEHYSRSEGAVIRGRPRERQPMRTESVLAVRVSPLLVVVQGEADTKLQIVVRKGHDLHLQKQKTDGPVDFLKCRAVIFFDFILCRGWFIDCFNGNPAPRGSFPGRRSRRVKLSRGGRDKGAVGGSTRLEHPSIAQERGPCAKARRAHAGGGRPRANGRII